MKNKILLGLSATFLLSGCIKFEDKSADPNAGIKQAESKECYLYTTGRDSIKLSMVTNANNVNGELSFNFYQKDKSNGTLSGLFIGDTLFADYTFRSEGMKSVREMVFLRQQDKLTVASGDMEERDGKQVFKEDGNVTFEDGIELQKTECN